MGVCVGSNCVPNTMRNHCKRSFYQLQYKLSFVGLKTTSSQKMNMQTSYKNFLIFLTCYLVPAQGKKSKNIKHSEKVVVSIIYTIPGAFFTAVSFSISPIHRFIHFQIFGQDIDYFDLGRKCLDKIPHFPIIICSGHQIFSIIYLLINSFSCFKCGR